MNTKLGTIYILSFCFLLMFHESNQNSKPKYFYYNKSHPIVENKRNIYRKIYSNPLNAELLISYVSGDKKRLTKKIKTAHKNLTIYHLFTPSGIHLSSLYLLLFPFLYFLKAKSKKLHFLFSALLCLPPLFLPRFYSIKRLSVLRFITLLASKLPFKVPPFLLFILSFTIDFFFGTFKSSPLSFIYSFLFLGIIFSSIGRGKKLLPFAFLGGQIIISYFQFTPLTTLGFIMGFFLTGLFTFIFPFLFAGFWLVPHLHFIHWFNELVIEYFKKVVLFCNDIAIGSGHYYSSIPLLLVVLTLTIGLGQKYPIKKIIIFALLIIHSDPLLNMTRSKFLKNQRTHSWRNGDLPAPGRSPKWYQPHK